MKSATQNSVYFIKQRSSCSPDTLHPTVLLCTPWYNFNTGVTCIMYTCLQNTEEGVETSNEKVSETEHQFKYIRMTD